MRTRFPTYLSTGAIRIAAATGEQDHAGIAMTVAVALGGLDQTFDLGDGQVFTGVEFRVRTTPRRNQSIVPRNRQPLRLRSGLVRQAGIERRPGL
jgi:hypothetical protein